MINRLLDLFVYLGAGMFRALEFAGQISILAGQSLWRMITPPYSLRDLIAQIDLLGIRSLKIALLTAASVGAVIALQFAYGLQKFGAKDYVGNVVSIALLRELAPVLTALIVGGRIGSGMAAELGSMKVGEQIDAIRALGADPIRKLIVPRLAASIIIMPMLTIFADIIGLVAAALLASAEYDVDPYYFYRSVVEFLDISDFLSGVGKSVFFGFFVAVIGCFQGFTTGGGTQGVGRSTTGTVEMISITVLVSDFFLTKLFMLIL